MTILKGRQTRLSRQLQKQRFENWFLTHCWLNISLLAEMVMAVMEINSENVPSLMAQKFIQITNYQHS